jgi:hypothetical protein
VPVYRNHRLVHLHVPKTAGTAIEDLFARAGDMTWDERCWYGTAHHSGRFWEYQHLTAVELRRLSRESFETYTAFAVVRDPLHRLISDYEWRRAVAPDGSDEVVTFDRFDDYLAAIPMDLDRNWDRYIALADRRWANHLVHVRPQWQYVCDRNGRLDDRIVVVRHECLHDDIAPLFDRHGVVEVLGPRPSTARALDDYFDAGGIARVRETYRTDMDWFGYDVPSAESFRSPGLRP